MIVRDKPSVYRLFFIFRGSIVLIILPQIIFIAILSTLVTVAHHHFSEYFPTFTIGPFTLLGVALSLFLGFRNNACYDRWWEARRQWGQLLVDSRSMARQATVFIDQQTQGGTEARQRLIQLSIAFNHALRHQLRNSSPWQDIEQYTEPGDNESLRQAANLCDALLRLMGQELASCRQKKLLSDILIQTLEANITSMAQVQAACERIRNTPLPFTYMLLVQRTVYLFCLILPFGLVSTQGFITPLFCAIVAYTFFGLDALSEQLGEPFGTAPNNLALSAMTRTAEINLLDILGDRDIPEPLQPVDFRLE